MQAGLSGDFQQLGLGVAAEITMVSERGDGRRDGSFRFLVW